MENQDIITSVDPTEYTATNVSIAEVRNDISTSGSTYTEESVEDIEDAFDALVDVAVNGTTQNLEDGTVIEHIDSVDDEFDRLVANTEGEEETPSIEEPEIPERDPKVIPVNCITTTLGERFSRFSGAPWFTEIANQNISVIGAGGIGSWAALIIARFGVTSISIVDGDYVESVNMSGQFYGDHNIGKSKSQGVASNIRNYCGYIHINAHNNFFTEYSSLHPITICGLDNMAARKIVFNKWKTLNLYNGRSLFIDGRLSADELQIFCFTGTQIDRIKLYEDKWLFDDTEAEETICSFKQTTYMATMIGSLIGNLVVNHCGNICSEDMLYELPFYINYNAEMMFFKAVNV